MSAEAHMRCYNSPAGGFGEDQAKERGEVKRPYKIGLSKYRGQLDGHKRFTWILERFITIRIG